MVCGSIPLALIPLPGPFGVETFTPCSRRHLANLTSCCSSACAAGAFDPEPLHEASSTLAAARPRLQSSGDRWRVDMGAPFLGDIWPAADFAGRRPCL